MKNLKDYILKEEGAAPAASAATPGNTIGIGNPMMPGGAGPNSRGSGDTFNKRTKTGKTKEEKDIRKRHNKKKTRLESNEEE